MKARRIVVIDGHPDSRAERFMHALARSYCDGARAAGHEIRVVNVAEVQFPLLHAVEDFRSGSAPKSIRECQEHVAWAEHVVILYPRNC